VSWRRAVASRAAERSSAYAGELLKGRVFQVPLHQRPQVKVRRCGEAARAHQGVTLPSAAFQLVAQLHRKKGKLAAAVRPPAFRRRRKVRWSELVATDVSASLPCCYTPVTLAFQAQDNRRAGQAGAAAGCTWGQTRREPSALLMWEKQVRTRLHFLGSRRALQERQHLW